MPTLFARRYMRDRVPRTERTVGVVVLALTGAIVAAVVVVSRAPSDPLFQVKPGNAKRSPERALVVARSMMPPLGTAGWSPATDVKVLPRERLDQVEAMQAGLSDFDVRCAYRGRYVCRNDPTQSVRVLICDAELPGNALGFYEANTPADARPLNVGCAGWQAGDAGAFWAGRYYTYFTRDNIRADEPSIRTIAGALASVQLCYGDRFGAATILSRGLSARDKSRGSGLSTRDESRGSGFAGLPEIALEGWGSATGVRVFTPVNLWEKIDGRAEMYLSFHMARMTFGTYRSRRDPDAFLDVYLYDMSEPDNAFGIYRAEMGAHPEPLDLGREGYQTRGGVFFWKGRHYVRVEAADDSVELADAAKSIARALAGQIEDDGRVLWADALLPGADRVEGSFDYHARDAFGLDFLDDTFSAEYRMGDTRFRTFVHRAESEANARAVFDAYGEFFQEFGSVRKRGSGDGFAFVVGDSGGVIDAVFIVGHHVGGVSGIEDAALAEQRMLAFAESLKIGTQSR